MNNWSMSFRENAHKTHISGKPGYESLKKKTAKSDVKTLTKLGGAPV
jgi:hypothetical protein